MRAFIYLRVSTADQEYSPEAQAQQCREYCAAHRHTVVDVFDETDVSGTILFADRPRGAELLERLGEVDAVVFSKLDRAFRDTVDCIMTSRHLAAMGKVVHFIDLGIDTSTPAGNLCLTMMAAFAEFERRRISDRTRESMAVAKKRGVKIGPAPFGYDNVVEFNAEGDRSSRGQHRVNDAEAITVARILYMAASGDGPTAIAAALNEVGIPTRLGGQWSKTHIVRILKREGAIRAGEGQ